MDGEGKDKIGSTIPVHSFNDLKRREKTSEVNFETDAGDPAIIMFTSVRSIASMPFDLKHNFHVRWILGYHRKAKGRVSITLYIDQQRWVGSQKPLHDKVSTLSPSCRLTARKIGIYGPEIVTCMPLPLFHSFACVLGSIAMCTTGSKLGESWIHGNGYLSNIYCMSKCTRF